MPPRTSPQKILVADDDRTIRHALVKLLKTSGYEVSAVGDGLSAWQQIEETKFDVVFLDVWMPGLTGLEVLARLRTGKNRPKAIVMTSDGTPETLLRAVREQAYDYISKPFAPMD